MPRAAILPSPSKCGSGAGAAGFAVLGALLQHGVAARVIQAHINAGRTRHTVAGDAKVLQRADHCIFQPVHIFLDEVAHALQIQQRIGHDLAGAVIRHLPTAIGCHHGNIAWVQQMIAFASQSLCEMG